MSNAKPLNPNEPNLSWAEGMRRFCRWPSPLWMEMGWRGGEGDVMNTPALLERLGGRTP